MFSFNWWLTYCEELDDLSNKFSFYDYSDYCCILVEFCDWLKLIDLSSRDSLLDLISYYLLLISSLISVDCFWFNYYLFYWLACSLLILFFYNFSSIDESDSSPQISYIYASYFYELDVSFLLTLLFKFSSIYYLFCRLYYFSYIDCYLSKLLLFVSVSLESCYKSNP